MSDDKTIYISKRKTKVSLTGQVIEEDNLTVQGKPLKECRKHFNELWGEV